MLRRGPILLVHFLTKQGYTRSDYDECLWEYKNGKKRLYLIVFVDDVLAIGDDDYIASFMETMIDLRRSRNSKF